MNDVLYQVFFPPFLPSGGEKGGGVVSSRLLKRSGQINFPLLPWSNQGTYIFPGRPSLFPLFLPHLVFTMTEAYGNVTGRCSPPSPFPPSTSTLCQFSPLSLSFFPSQVLEVLSKARTFSPPQALKVFFKTAAHLPPFSVLSNGNLSDTTLSGWSHPPFSPLHPGERS